jgi:hypothetical protein
LAQSYNDEGASDITQKAVSDIRVESDRAISIRKLRVQNQNGNCLSRLCRAFAGCFGCLNSNEEELGRNAP